MNDLDKKQLAFDTSSEERKLLLKTNQGNIVDLTYLDKASKMTDLEKLKAVFDDIGVEYDECDFVYSISLQSDALTQVFINFKDGKFTHID